MTDTERPPDAFTIERHGDVTLVTGTPALESLDAALEEQVAEVLIDPLRRQVNPLLVFDLTDVNYFGSMFLTVLLRCWKVINGKGGMMALAGVRPHAKELLRLTALDMIWPMYPTRREALEAMLSD